MSAPAHFSHWELAHFLEATDFVVVGSGLVGINAALRLRELHPKASIRIVEAGILPAGASSKNAGFCCFGSASELLDDLKSNDADAVFHLVKQRWQGLLFLRELIGDRFLQFEQFGGHELFTHKDNALYVGCVDQLQFLNDELAPIVGPKAFELRDDLIAKNGLRNIEHILYCPYEGQINTGLMMRALLQKVHASNIDLLQGVRIDAIEDVGSHVAIACSKGVELKAGRVIVATNGFAKELMPHLEVQPARAQVLITSPIKDLTLKGTFHYDRGYYYLRNVGDRVLFGGGRHLDYSSETTNELKTTPKIQNKLIELLEAHFLTASEIEIEHQWAGVMGVGKEKSPIVEHISARIVCAVRLGGMGVALGSYTGRAAAEAIDP